jgi:sulfite dehydrogenase (cytochrome) subunit B
MLDRGKKFWVLLTGAGFCAVWLIGADGKFTLPPETSKFKPGSGADLAAANCLLCHSADYISTQPLLSRDAWKASVEKMRQKYGAPIPPDKVDAIADYLQKNYGKASVAP